MLQAFESVFVLFAKPIIYTRALKGRKAPLLWHMCHPLSLRLCPLCAYLLQSNVFLIGRGKKSQGSCLTIRRYQISSAQSACHSVSQMVLGLIDGWAS